MADTKTFRKVRGVSDKKLIGAIVHIQGVLQQVAGALTELENRLAAVEEFVRMLGAAGTNPSPDEAMIEEVMIHEPVAEDGE